MNSCTPDHSFRCFYPIEIILSHIHVRIQRGGQGFRTPPENHKNIGFSRNTGTDPLKNRSYQASIQCLAIISMPAKRHSMAFRWRADDGLLIVVLGSSLPSSTRKKNNVKIGPPLTKLSGSAHDIPRTNLWES